jgi:hypothetical protein
MYRDNRLNPIHEGTTGIQSLDLLARKVPQNNLAGYRACLVAMGETISEAADLEATAAFADELSIAVDKLKEVTDFMLGAMVEKDIDLALANSVKYLDLFGNVVIAWVWLQQGVVAGRALQADLHESEVSFYRGKLQAMQYFFRYDLSEIYGWAKLLMQLDDTCIGMENDWF